MATHNEECFLTDIKAHLDRFNDPPVNSTPESDEFWKAESDDLIRLGQKYKANLMWVIIGSAMQEYLEKKALYKTRQQQTSTAERHSDNA